MRYQITKTDFIQLLQHLMKESVVDQVLSGKIKKDRFTIAPDYIDDPSQLDSFPLSQLFVYGYAKTDSTANELLHSKKALSTKLAVIGRACDVRAMVELEKKKREIKAEIGSLRGQKLPTNESAFAYFMRQYHKAIEDPEALDALGAELYYFLKHGELKDAA